MRKISTLLASAALFTWGMPVTQAADMFLDFPDTDITGESVEALHVGEIDLVSWSWGLSTEPGRKAVGVVVEDMIVKKQVDSATSELVVAALLGQNLGRAVLSVRPPTPAGGKPQKDYIVLTMNNVVVASFNTGGAGTDERLTETVGLSFDSISGLYLPDTAAGNGTPIDFNWDLATNSQR